MRVWLAALALGGCFHDELVACGDHACPVGDVCANDKCVAQAQVDACVGADEGASCSFPGTPAGVCHAQVCVLAGCGNGVVEPGELCDDGNRVSGDGCRSDCLSQEICGDAVVEPALGETCDCGSPGNGSPTWRFGTSDAPTIRKFVV